MHCDHLASHNRSGFTLIELTIVLVIIGLIAGGVLFGRDLITSASIRAQISQLESYETAYHTFKSKYGCLPGDCAKASQLSLTDEGSDGNGNGDGVIGFVPVDFSFFALGIEQYETLNFWEHLSKAGLIGNTLKNGKNAAIEAGVTVPQAKLDNSTVQLESMAMLTTSNTTMFPLVNRADALVIKGAGSYNGLFNSLGSSMGISPQQSYAIDSKIDDGLPLSGRAKIANLIECANETNCRVVAFSQIRINPPIPPNINEFGEEIACIDETTTPVSYYLSTTLNAAAKCDMVIKASF
jgi:prepilin-type N-terminal cleavage/methylation domain-containing protein